MDWNRMASMGLTHHQRPQPTTNGWTGTLHVTSSATPARLRYCLHAPLDNTPIMPAAAGAPPQAPNPAPTQEQQPAPPQNGEAEKGGGAEEAAAAAATNGKGPASATPTTEPPVTSETMTR